MKKKRDPQRKPAAPSRPTPTVAPLAKNIGFAFAKSRESNDHEVRPKAGAVDLIDCLDSGQLRLDPPEFFAQPPLPEDGWLCIGRCSCGVVRCGDLVAKVTVQGDEVTWQLTPTAQFVFDRTDYLTAWQSAREDTSWESVQRAAERRVMQLDFSPRNKKGSRFEWASARIKRKVMTLSFQKAGRQVLFEVAWNGTDPADAVVRVQQWIDDGV